jgi:hypothetical protein
MENPERKAVRNRLHAERLRETAKAAPAIGTLKARLLDLASRYDRLAKHA